MNMFKAKERKKLPKAEAIASIHASAGKLGVGPGGSVSGVGEEEDEGDVIEDDDNLGPENEKMGIKAISTAGSNSPLFITKVHSPTPIRQMCWVPPAQKLISASSGADLMVWHVYMERSGYATWDLRVALRGVLSVHQKIVTEMVFLRDLGLLATSSMDTTVALWGIRGLSDGVGGRRGFPDSPTYKPGYIQKLPKGHASAGVFLVSHAKDVHARGVRSLLYVPSVRMLFSAGYEPFIQAWDMAIEDGTPTYRLIGHMESVVGMASLEPPDMKFEVKTDRAVAGASAAANADLAILRKRQAHFAQIVSVDEGGQFRWWDCARDTSVADGDRCLQTWFPMSATMSNQKFAALGLVCTRVPPRPKAKEGSSDASTSVKEAAAGPALMQGAVIIGVGSRLKCFEALRQDDDRAVPAIGLYHDVTSTFCAVTQQDIRWFDAQTGLMGRVYRAALPVEACSNCCTFDGRRRKLFVGCSGGSILCFNTFNCRIMKALPKHSMDVSGLVYCNEDSTIISTGWDGRLHIVDEMESEMDGERVGLMRRVKRAHGVGVPITALAFDYKLSLIATAGGNGKIRIWDYQDLSFLGDLSGHDGEISCLTFLSPWPVLVSADVLGVVNVWRVARGVKPLCIASMAHRPSSSETPPPMKPSEEAVLYQGLALRARMAAFMGNVTRRMHARVTGPGEGQTAAARPVSAAGGGAYSAREAALQAVRTPVAAGGLASPSTGPLSPGPVRGRRNSIRGDPYRLVSVLQTGLRDDLVQSTQEAVTSLCVLPPTDALACMLVNPAGLPVSAQDGGLQTVQKAGDTPSRVYPTLLVGDEQGRLSLYDLSHVLEPISMELGPVPEGSAGGQVEAGVDKEGLGTRLVTGSNNSTGTAQPGSVLIPLRGRIERVPEAKLPCNSGVYHPRKMVKRTGPAPLTKRKDFTREELELMEQLAQRPEGAKARTPLRALSLALPPGLGAAGATAGGYTAPAAQRAQGAQRQASAHGDDEEQEDGDGDDIVSVASSEDTGDEPTDLAHEEETVSPPVSPLRLPPPPSAGMQTTAAPLSALPEMPSMFEEGKQSGATTKELPSRSIPALARCVGDAWAPVHLAYAHGLFFDAAVTDDPTAAAQDKKGAARHNKRVDARGLGSGSKSGWKGFPIRSIRLIATVELVCVLTASEDGTLRAFDLRGKPLAALPVATGRRGADATSSALAGRSVVSALAQGMDWRISLEGSLKQHILTQYAQACLAALEGAKAKVKVVQDAKLAGRVNSIERSELRDAEKRIRRSSIVAAYDFLEPSVAKKKAKMLALRAATGDVVPGDASSMPDRARVIGQLFGAETWKKDVLDEAKEAALRTAARVEGRRGSVSAMISSTLGVSVMAMKAQVEAAKAEERDFSGPIPENSAIAAPPRADADVLPSARDGSSTGGRPPSHLPATVAQGTAQLQAKMMEKLLAEPSIRSLIELSTAEREEFKAGFLAGPGGRRKKKRLNVIGLSGSTTTALPPAAARDAAKDGTAQNSTTGGDGDGDGGEADSGDEEERVEFDLEAHLAAMTPAERKLRQIRAIGAMAATESGGRISVNGVVLQDPSKAAAAAAVSAKESRIYPSFYAEAHRPSAIELAQAAAKAKGMSTESKLSESYVSTFLAEHMEQLRMDTARKARQEQLARGAQAVAANATRGTQSNAAASSSSMSVGGARAAAASLSRSRQQQPVTTPIRPSTATGLARMGGPSSGSHEEAQEGEAVLARPLVRAGEALDQALRKSDAPRSRAMYPMEGSASSALASLPSGTRLDVLKSALQGMFEGGPGGGRPGSSAGGRPKARTVTEMLKERNPRLMAHLESMREKKRRGSILVSMSDTALQVKVTEAIAQEEAAERAAKQRRKSFLAQKQAALDAAEAACNPQVAAAAGSAGIDREGAAGESGSTGTASPNPGAAKKNAATSWAVAPEEKLTPSQFYMLSRQNRVGGALKRDVLAFQQLIRTADRNGDGTVGYDEFVAFIESGSSGLSHMKGHLESLFRSADKSGNGLLSVPELAAIMFPKASSAHLKEIVLFVTYIGPSEPGKKNKKSNKVYSEDTLRQLRELFSIYDADGGGTIDRAEMLAAMTAITGGMHTGPGGAVNTIAAQEEAHKMMAIADASGDGEISFEEFVRLMGPAFEMDTI